MEQTEILSPTISAFFGILIRMYYKEHGIPHFHAEYQATFSSTVPPSR